MRSDQLTAVVKWTAINRFYPVPKVENVDLTFQPIQTRTGFLAYVLFDGIKHLSSKRVGKRV